jgi:hypothetical protein
VYHPGEIRREQPRVERCHVELGQAVDAGDLVARADLDQAELRVVRLLAHELRVDGSNRSVLERRDESRERRVVVDPAYFLRCGHRRSSLPRRLRYHPDSWERKRSKCCA